MRRSMASALWKFSTTRMLHDYVERMYFNEPAPDAKTAPEATTKVRAGA
jgi:hypothetical protein